MVAKAYGVLNSGDITPPSIPQNFTATTVSATQVDLACDPSTDNIAVVEYQFWRDGLPIDSSPTPSLSDTGLTPETTYAYTVTAVDEAGNNSGFSNEDTATTDPNSAPVWAISNQDLLTGEAYFLDLNSVCTDVDADDVIFSVVSGTLPSGITLTGDILSGTPDTVETQIVTLGATDNLAARQDVAVTFDVTIPDTTAPPVPTGMSIPRKTQNTIDIDWDSVANAEPDFDGYNLYRSTNGVDFGLHVSGIGLNPPPESFHQDTGLNASTQYWYYTTSIDTSGNESVASDTVTDITDPFALSDTPDYVDPVEGVTLLGGRNIVDVSNNSELTSALSSAVAGDTIRLANGTYSTNLTMDKTVPANNPIIVTALNDHQAILTGTITMTGARQILTKCRIEGNVQFRGDNNKLLANHFTNWTGNAIVPGNNASPGSHGEIAYNEAWSPADWGPDTGSNTQFRMWIRALTGGDGQSSTVHTDCWVHHNLIRDLPEKPNPSRFSSGQSDSYEPGESNYDWTPFPGGFSAGWYIENNLDRDHLQSGGGAVLDLKLPGCVVRGNTVKDCASPRLDIRFGHSTVLESNWFDDGGTEVHGRGNIIVGNNFNGTGSSFFGIRLICGAFSADSDENAQTSTADTLVTGNTGDLTVGTDRGGVAVDNTTIEDHTGSITLVSGCHTNTINNSGSPSSRNFIAPAELSDSDVGPTALTNATSAYLAARVP